MRNPEPLGTEFKSVAEVVTCVMMDLETTRNKDDDTTEEYDGIITRLGCLEKSISTIS